MITRFVSNYIDRHRNRTNQAFHLVGVPLTFVVPVVFLVREDSAIAAGCFVGGYVLQFIGHAFEGNDAGELILIKKMLGKPYVEFAPDPSDSSPSQS